MTPHVSLCGREGGATRTQLHLITSTDRPGLCGIWHTTAICRMEAIHIRGKTVQALWLEIKNEALAVVPIRENRAQLSFFMLQTMLMLHNIGSHSTEILA